MRFHLKFLVFFVILAVVAAKHKKCDDINCTAQYEPVCANCAGVERTFGNGCEMGIFNCRFRNICKVVRTGTCDGAGGEV